MCTLIQWQRNQVFRVTLLMAYFLQKGVSSQIDSPESVTHHNINTNCFSIRMLTIINAEETGTCIALGSNAAPSLGPPVIPEIHYYDVAKWMVWNVLGNVRKQKTKAQERPAPSIPTRALWASTTHGTSPGNIHSDSTQNITLTLVVNYDQYCWILSGCIRQWFSFELYSYCSLNINSVS